MSGLEASGSGALRAQGVATRTSGASGSGAMYPSRLLPSSTASFAQHAGEGPDARKQATLRAMAHDIAVATAASTAAHGAETEITIHIGRIDVTAVRGPAAKPVHAPAASPAAMSLDTYLSRRQRSGA